MMYETMDTSDKKCFEILTDRDMKKEKLLKSRYQHRRYKDGAIVSMSGAWCERALFGVRLQSMEADEAKESVLTREYRRRLPMTLNKI